MISSLDFQSAARQIDDAVHGIGPWRFPAVLHQLDDVEMRPMTLRAFLARRRVMAWAPMMSVILAALFGTLRIYLCWGVAHHRGVRRLLVRMILRRADHVIVNDLSTAGEVKRLAGVTPHLVPYVVDTAFFPVGDSSIRTGFLFCPSSNDRDGDILLRIAEAGTQVVWMTHYEWHHERFANRHPLLTLVRDISFHELKGYYQRARAVVLPLVRDIHAAGQTTTLEALACGTPVIISSGRTADIFRDHELVTEVSTTDARSWIDAVGQAVAVSRANPRRSSDQADLIKRSNGVDAFLAALRPYLAGRGK